MNTFQKINRQLRERGWPMRLLKGRGYVYFVYDGHRADGSIAYDTRSVYICTATDRDVEFLLGEAVEFHDDMINER